MLTTITDTTHISSEDSNVISPPEDGKDSQTATRQDQVASYTERPMIPVSLLAAHPGSVREEKKADEALRRSVAASGVVTPLEITVNPDDGGTYLVVDGLLRLDAAIAAGLETVPYFFSQGTADEQGLAYLHMLITSRFRTGLTVYEEAAALFSASEAGLNRTEIRRATGLPAGEVRAGIRAGKLTDKTRELARYSDYEWTLEDLALLAPFEDDPDAMDRIITAVGYGRPLPYVIELITKEKADAAHRASIISGLRESGQEVAEEVPPGAIPVTLLLASSGTLDGAADSDSDNAEDGDAADRAAMTAEEHAACPGALVVLRPWQAEPTAYCTDPDSYGHDRLYPVVASSAPAAESRSGDAAVLSGTGTSPDPDRRLVIEGNRAWAAAAKVRQRWLTVFLAGQGRRSTTVIARFVAGQLITMPHPLHQALPGIARLPIYGELGGQAPGAAETAGLPRLWVLALAPIAAAYEDQMTGDGEKKATWRTDRYAPCLRKDAGTWLRFCAQLGHQLTPVEQAVADGVPYLGDSQPETEADLTGTLEADDAGPGDPADTGQDAGSIPAPGEAAEMEEGSLAEPGSGIVDGAPEELLAA